MIASNSDNSNKMEIEAKRCDICGKVDDWIPVERLPNGGILWRVKHSDGNEHEWSEYPNLESVHAKDDRPENQDMYCPECGRIGKIKAWLNDAKGHPDSYTYGILHNATESKPGVVHIANDGKKRNAILKALQRDIYITRRKTNNTSKRKPRSKMEVKCPKCGDSGMFTLTTGDGGCDVFYVTHSLKKTPQMNSSPRCVLKVEQGRALLAELQQPPAQTSLVPLLSPLKAENSNNDKKRQKRPRRKGAGRPLSKIPRGTRNILEDDNTKDRETIKKYERHIQQLNARIKRREQELESRK